MQSVLGFNENEAFGLFQFVHTSTTERKAVRNASEQLFYQGFAGILSIIGISHS